MGRQGRQSRPVGTLTSRVCIIRAGSEQAFEIAPGALSILDAGLDAGVDLPFSCCAGICTSCCAKLLQGSVSDAPQTVLDDAEQAAGYILCCQVLPTSSEIRLTFDEPLVRDMEA
ncbi:MAG: 2Fe-2S iron-sulfur cluster-binding protein [Pseudomonadales bacterium]